jgi:hypothetical protein
MKMSLNEWLEKGWVKAHRAAPLEIRNLLQIADRDIRQSRVQGLDNDTRLSLSYNAALQCCAAALSAAGYRASHGAYHYHLIQSLAFTLKPESSLINTLDKFRQKRNISEYERAGAVSEKEADRMLQIAEDIRDKVESWLRSNYPELAGEI